MSTILEGKVAVVTGAAKGIGKAIARRFAAEGAQVVLSDIDAEAAGQVADALSSAMALRCDVTREGEVASLVAQTLRQHGRLDVMVNNAGTVDVGAVVGLDLERWRRTMAVNLDGVFLGIKHAAPAIAAGGGGSIINIASIKAFGGLPTLSAYSASKAAVVSLTKSAALELRDVGVRVNAICPGYVATEMVRENTMALQDQTGMDLASYVDHLQGRFGEPEEISGLALFLASDRSRMVNAAALVADGGATSSLL